MLTQRLDLHTSLLHRTLQCVSAGTFVVAAAVLACAIPGVVRADDASATAQGFARSCDRGDVGSCTALGRLYWEGHGVPKDPEHAAKLFRGSCDGGDAEGCRNLGELYAQGLGVPNDDLRALALFELACEGGDQVACSRRLGLFAEGRGLELSIEAPDPNWQWRREHRPYRPKVGGLLWLEAFAGPSFFDPDQYTKFLNNPPPSMYAPRLKGPEVGAVAGVSTARSARKAVYSFGWFYRQANYTAYKLMKTGVDFQITGARYVQPLMRVSAGYMKLFGGDASTVLVSGSDGASLGLGFGLRIPIVRWISLVASADYTWTFVVLDEKLSDGTTSVVGGQLSGNFGLTFHFIGS